MATDLNPEHRERILLEILTDCLDDWIPVDRVIGYAEEAVEEYGGQPPAVFRALLGTLLERALVTVGDIGDSGYEPWDGTASEVLERTVNACEELGWDPRLAGPWVASTPEGDRLAEAHASS
ncbi:hypothetical protein OG897_31430 [Streptomyces sp. NBC_00237]|uniref:hypothetical protein n=1 Tax=Streptomyces sp. NBC_00237 TaxID=2975687 RepID=UPI00225BDAD8|nr:hypothetical protein [Streptomyces sp. NBC_00237]MCX5205927.1 hypothetical protein [Streptomyces sp. NBC_00237]